MEQVEALKALKPEENKQEIKSDVGIFPKDVRTNDIKNEIYEIYETKICEKKERCKILRR